MKKIKEVLFLMAVLGLSIIGFSRFYPAQASVVGTWLYSTFIVHGATTLDGNVTTSGTLTAPYISSTGTFALSGGSLGVSSATTASGATQLTFGGAYSTAQVASLTGVIGKVILDLDSFTLCVGSGTTTGGYVYISTGASGLRHCGAL